MSGDHPYDRDATVAAIRSFYTYLTTLPKLSPSVIEDAPSGGWPDITSDFLSPLNKNETVIDLLKHLPYICESGQQVSYETRAINYKGSNVKWNLDRGDVEGVFSPFGAGVIPNYVAVLTTGARYGSWLLLDTNDGTVTDYIMMERPERSEPDRDSPDYWRAYKTLPIQEFFEDWKEKYRSLEWVVIPENVDDGVLLTRDANTDKVRDIYRAHGWPDNFRREECGKAVIEWDQNK